MNRVNVLLDFACSAGYDTLPMPARQAARTFLADAVSVGISGSTEDSATRVLQTAASWGSGDTATVLGTSTRLPAASAAFVNSFQVHCQEFDPLHEAATVHAMAVLSGALLAVAEAEDASSEDLLLATALGVDVAVTLGLAAKEGLRFFRPATAGALGTTVALTRLLDLDRETSLDALGLAYSQLAGTMQAHVEGSVALPVQIAHAARAAVTAVDLAKAGLDGPHDILDGPFGYFTLYEREGGLGDLAQSLGQPWRITELSHKPFPTGRAAHAMLHAMRALQRQHAFELDDIQSVTVTIPPLVRRLVARPARAGMSVNYARLCLEYLLARLLQAGNIDASAFERSALDDATLLAFGQRVDFVDDDSHGVDVLSPQSMRLVLQGGTPVTYDVPHTPGSPDNPLSREEREQKFSRCVSAAGIDPAPLGKALDGLPATASTRDLLALASSASPRRR